MLPNRRQKRKWNLTSCSWKTKFGTLHMEKKLPACAFYLCLWRRGRQGNIALFCKWKRVDLCIQIVARSANCMLLLAAGRRSWAFTHGKKLPACAFYLCLWHRGRRGNVSLFYSWKRVDLCFQLVAGSAYCNFINAKGMQTAALYLRQTEYLFADL